MRAIMEVPLPRTPDGARRLGVAINAQFRAERWASRRRWATLVALVVGLALAFDNSLRLLPGGVRHVLVVGWWTALAATIASLIVEAWSTARMERALEKAADA